MDSVVGERRTASAPQDAADVPSAPDPASEVLGPPEAPEIIFAAPPTQPPERVDAKLWSGASAAGWRLSCGTGGSGDKFRSPSGISIDSRERALEAAAFEDAPAVSLLRDGFAQNWAGARARVPRAAFAGFEVVDGFAECAVVEYRVRPQEPPLPPCEEVRLAPGADHSALGELWVTKKQLLGESAIVRDLPCELVDPPHSGGEAIVGRRVCVYWEGDDAWYAGAIVRFAAAAPSGSARWPPPREAFHSGRHRVQYDDGTAEWVLLAAERYRLLPAAAAAARGAGGGAGGGCGADSGARARAGASGGGGAARGGQRRRARGAARRRRRRRGRHRVAASGNVGTRGHEAPRRRRTERRRRRRGRSRRRRQRRCRRRRQRRRQQQRRRRRQQQLKRRRRRGHQHPHQRRVERLRRVERAARQQQQRSQARAVFGGGGGGAAAAASRRRRGGGGGRGAAGEPDRPRRRPLRQTEGCGDGRRRGGRGGGDGGGGAPSGRAGGRRVHGSRAIPLT